MGSHPINLGDGSARRDTDGRDPAPLGGNGVLCPLANQSTRDNKLREKRWRTDGRKRPSCRINQVREAERRTRLGTHPDGRQGHGLGRACRHRHHLRHRGHLHPQEEENRIAAKEPIRPTASTRPVAPRQAMRRDLCESPAAKVQSPDTEERPPPWRQPRATRAKPLGGRHLPATRTMKRKENGRQQEAEGRGRLAWPVAPA